MKGDFENLKDALTPIVREISPHIFHPSDVDKREMVKRGLIANMDESLEEITLVYVIEGYKVTVTVENNDLIVEEGE